MELCLVICQGARIRKRPVSIAEMYLEMNQLVLKHETQRVDDSRVFTEDAKDRHQ